MRSRGASRSSVTETKRSTSTTYDHHLKWDGIDGKARLATYYSSVYQGNPETPELCPDVVQPGDVHFIVINMERSYQRLLRIGKRFQELGLPAFDRFVGIEPKEGQVYDIPRHKSREFMIGDYGCALSHREIWKHVANGTHEWVAVMEDDVTPESYALMTSFPPVPVVCDSFFISTNVVAMDRLCRGSEISQLLVGYGTWGYLINRKMASHMLELSKDGFKVPVDMWMYGMTHACTDERVRQRASHPSTRLQDHNSVRLYVNGIADRYNDQAST